MRTLYAATIGVLMVLLAACGGGSEPTPTPPPPAAAATTVIEIEADANLLAFKQTELEVQAGQQVTLRLVNPSTVFQHNWILVDGGDDVAKEIDELAVQAGPDANYIPEDPRVLAAIPLVDMGQTGEVTFTAPTTPGEYAYLCSFPGHYLAGMAGVLVVR